jgi:hypothetical protein
VWPSCPTLLAGCSGYRTAGLDAVNGIVSTGANVSPGHNVDSAGSLPDREEEALPDDLGALVWTGLELDNALGEYELKSRWLDGVDDGLRR